MENTRKQMEEGIAKQMAAIGEELTAIMGHIPKEPAQYADRYGKTHYECPWAYDDYLSRAMASDMFSFYPMFYTRYPELAEHVMKWTEKMTNLNYRLMRMFDDDEGNRPCVHGMGRLFPICSQPCRSHSVLQQAVPGSSLTSCGTPL